MPLRTFFNVVLVDETTHVCVSMTDRCFRYHVSAHIWLDSRISMELMNINEDAWEARSVLSLSLSNYSWGCIPSSENGGGSSSASPAHYTADHTYDTTPWSDSDHGSLSLTLAKISTREECLLGHTCFGHVMSTYPLYSQKTCYREIIQHSEPSWVY